MNEMNYVLTCRQSEWHSGDSSRDSAREWSD